MLVETIACLRTVTMTEQKRRNDLNLAITQLILKYCTVGI